MTLAEVLKELRELDEKATKTDWVLGSASQGEAAPIYSLDDALANYYHSKHLIVNCHGLESRENAALITKTRNYLPGLLQVIEKQREALEQLYKDCIYADRNEALSGYIEVELAKSALAFDPFKGEK